MPASNILLGVLHLHLNTVTVLKSRYMPLLARLNEDLGGGSYAGPFKRKPALHMFNLLMTAFNSLVRAKTIDPKKIRTSAVHTKSARQFLFLFEELLPLTIVPGLDFCGTKDLDDSAAPMLRLWLNVFPPAR
eukprot:m.142782 g.142782  ORF g.142782 m.142782 type:complete len:132 (-) comp10040_c0_seq3:2346-2741(-)